MKRKISDNIIDELFTRFDRKSLIIALKHSSLSLSLSECTDHCLESRSSFSSLNTFSRIISLCAYTCPTGLGTISSTSYCTDVSVSNGITIGQRLNTVYVPSGSDVSLSFRGGSWGALTAGGSTYSILTYINLVSRMDNGKYNNAPVSTVMSRINIKVNETTSIIIPVSDADGDNLRCRWATSSNGVDEWDTVCPPSSLPTNTMIYSNCTILITGQVEDFLNASSMTPLSSVPAQFLVKVIAASSCVYQPEVLLLADSCTPLKVNQTLTSTLLAINNCGTIVTIIDISTIYYKNLTWKPTTNQIGYQVMCAIALDSQNSQSLQYCFTFYVTENGENTCPGVTYITTTITKISTAGETNNTKLIRILVGLSFILALTISCCLVCCYKKYVPTKPCGSVEQKPMTTLSAPTDKTIETISTASNLNEQSLNMSSEQEKAETHLRTVHFHQKKT
ncbi:unnamed protein product [Rotaria socialis]